MKIPKVTEKEIEAFVKENIRDLQLGLIVGNDVALGEWACKNARKLISLWDMNQIIAKDFLAAWSLLKQAIGLSDKNRAREATKEERDILIKALIEAHCQSGNLGLRQSAELCKRLLDQLKDPGNHRVWSADLTKPGYTMPKEAPLPHFDSVYWQLQGIVTEMQKEMKLIRLAVIWKDQAPYFEQDSLFGEQFHKNASAKINAEIKAAGNCLAAVSARPPVEKRSRLHIAGKVVAHEDHLRRGSADQVHQT
jgi:hypothetical protein